MMKKLRLLFQVLCIMLVNASCDDSVVDDFNSDGTLGQWYVVAIQGDYRMDAAVAEAETETYLNDFFYSYNLNFFMGEGLDFLDDDQLVVWQLDDLLTRYDYNWNENSLTVSRGRFQPTFYVTKGNTKEMRITFNRSSLVNHLKDKIYNTVNAADQEYLKTMIYRIESQVKTFYVSYYLRRQMPSVQTIISGNFYGKVVNLDNNTILFPDAAVSLVQNSGYVDLYMLDAIRIGNSAPFTVEMPRLEITEGQLLGNYDFWGIRSILVENLGTVGIEVRGLCQAGNVVDMLITLTTRNGVYSMEYQNGYRNVLLPYDGNKAAKAKRTINLTTKEN